ncbi:hypothetical protein ET445_06180 [Agromyces protaetiae]|uniref:PKD domain-containing protein n=1 Tax=Agromyces protaetiae TaxID=2509455 RepID=A0A4P6FAK7_9MICO|nr:PKD domain-containing protein [Agromyces protaetiae]QAY72992.1 hypothetical protein ET445_06180 [Agromyces protaetiae]
MTVGACKPPINADLGDDEAVISYNDTLAGLQPPDRDDTGSARTAVEPVADEPPAIPWTDICGPTNPNDLCEPGTPIVITLNDIASFRPVTPVDLTEPGAWGLMNRPVNFVSGATTQIIAGSLVDHPADVRFTPVGYGWDFGDGTSDTFTTPGATWEQLGVAEFGETDTSHVYDSRGTFTVTPSVVYRAEYRFNGSSWAPIAGTLTLRGTPRDILIGRIDTVLVKGDCNQYPGGPGC